MILGKWMGKGASQCVDEVMRKVDDTKREKTLVALAKESGRLEDPHEIKMKYLAKFVKYE